jgi:hypothetical protein
MKKYVCTICGYEYDPEPGDLDTVIQVGTLFLEPVLTKGENKRDQVLTLVEADPLLHLMTPHGKEEQKMKNKKGSRIEKDSMGEMYVPEDALWGPQIQRAIENFPISGYRVLLLCPGR